MGDVAFMNAGLFVHLESFPPTSFDILAQKGLFNTRPCYHSKIMVICTLWFMLHIIREGTRKLFIFYQINQNTLGSNPVLDAIPSAKESAMIRKLFIYSK
jgi:hypothetical protein